MLLEFASTLCCFYPQVALSISKHAILLFTLFFATINFANVWNWAKAVLQCDSWKRISRLGLVEMTNLISLMHAKTYFPHFPRRRTNYSKFQHHKITRGSISRYWRRHNSLFLRRECDNLFYFFRSRADNSTPVKINAANASGSPAVRPAIISNALYLIGNRK